MHFSPAVLCSCDNDPTFALPGFLALSTPGVNDHSLPHVRLLLLSVTGAASSPVFRSVAQSGLATDQVSRTSQISDNADVIKNIFDACLQSPTQGPGATVPSAAGRLHQHGAVPAGGRSVRATQTATRPAALLVSARDAPLPARRLGCAGSGLLRGFAVPLPPARLYLFRRLGPARRPHESVELCHQTSRKEGHAKP